MKNMYTARTPKETLISGAILVSALIVSSFILFGSGAISFAQQPDEGASAPVSQWNGDAISGKTATDVSGGNDGSLVGGVTTISGKSGKAFQFDGSTGYITMGNPGNLNFGTAPFAIEADFRWDGGGSSANSIVRKSNYPVKGPGSGYWLRIGKDTKTVEFSVGATTGPEGQSLIVAPISPGAWHHVTASKDYSGALALYVDGKSKGTVVRQSPKSQSTSEAPFTLGAWNDRFGVTELFSGAIEEVSVYAHPLFDEYPVPDLGNRTSQSECRAYCEKSEHFRTCIAFVKKHHLASLEEIAKWEEFLDVVESGGPGGCKNEEECINYCEDAHHLVECTDFVEKHNLVSPEELAEMRKIAAALKAGAKLPGDCRNKKECISYCEDSVHAEECVDFGEKAGFISKKDAEFVRKSGGKSPGDCARGAKTPEEGKKSCNAFCSKSENQQVCMDFAVQIGLISADDAKEMSGGGSLEDFNACLPYIDEKALKCFDVLGKDTFEKLKAGEVPDDLDDMKGMIAKMKEVRQCMNKNTDETFSKLPPGGLACLEKELGDNPLEKIKAGKVSCRQFAGMQDRIQACFMEKMQAETDSCLSLSCAEVPVCLKKMGTGEQNTKSQLDPAIEKKLKDRINACIGEQINECLSKDCSEVQACFGKLQQGGGGEKKGESQMDPALDAKIKEKMTGCFKNQTGGGGAGNIGADECAKQGGMWDGKQCDFSKKGAGEFGATECSKQGGVWTGSQCDFSAKGAGILDATECSKQGGTWDGVKCDFSAKGAGLPGDQSQIPQGYTSWQAFCADQPSDSRCAAYKPDCSPFASVPSCSFLGSPDSQNYKYCKQCYPDK